jgi:hypothetical protein
MIGTSFAQKYTPALLDHFDAAVASFQVGDWEKATLRCGKFVESTLKALWSYLGNPVPKSKDFKVDAVIRQLEQTPSANADDTIRLTIPRACRFIYEVASNRGARHDPDEVNPNRMDASTVVSLCAWILAEMLRYSQKGSLDPAKAADAVASLTEKKFPLIELVDGRAYFHVRELSARDIALLSLWRIFPNRLSKKEVAAAVVRHQFSAGNAKMAVSRLGSVVDDDGDGNLRLLSPGVEEAESLLSRAAERSKARS